MQMRQVMLFIINGFKMPTSDGRRQSFPPALLALLMLVLLSGCPPPCKGDGNHVGNRRTIDIPVSSPKRVIRGKPSRQGGSRPSVDKLPCDFPPCTTPHKGAVNVNVNKG
ncbi:hypothetical protein PVAP13_8NG350800 [Panicum virgatum]|uniref:Secreted protein n=1 Tax=Panicum virgatum TaxID=38727 RepID=A0A8T0PB54_PANVG|nr:hypothetical protein PVAP13_8NG350800 [Panicum virgatum]